MIVKIKKVHRTQPQKMARYGLEMIVMKYRITQGARNILDS
jgi:hypothetical protein